MAFHPAALIDAVKAALEKIGLTTEGEVREELERLENQFDVKRDQVLQALADAKAQIIADAKDYAPEAKQVVIGALDALEQTIVSLIGGSAKTPANQPGENAEPLPYGGGETESVPGV